MTAGPSRLRRRRRLFTLLMPALVLRALIPFGFMPVATSAGLSIGLCPGVAELPPGVAHGHSHHHAGVPGGSQAPERHAPCLFSASGSVAGAPAIPACKLITPPLRAQDSTALPRIFSPTILRSQSPRAPPTCA
jgi:hypothetical protein